MTKTQFFNLPDGTGCRMAYRTHQPASTSSLPPLFLINGLSAVMDDWSPLVESLATTRTVVISDHRGIGESTVTEEWDQDLSLYSMGLDVIHLASHLGYKVIDLLGFSMGGHITQAILSSPEHASAGSDGVVVDGKVKVRKAILTATMVKLPRGDINLNELNEQAAKIKDKTARNDFITENLMRVQYHPEVLGPGKPLQNKFEQRLALVRKTNRPQWIIGLQFLAIQSQDLRKQLGRIPESLPVMLIHGKRDRMVLWEESEKILEGVKHAKRLKDTPSEEFGHFWYEYFELEYWVRSINNFLDAGKVGGWGGESKL